VLLQTDLKIIESQHLLSSRQSTYRVHHSTESIATAITAVRDEIMRAIDSGDVCGLVLLDLSECRFRQCRPSDTFKCAQPMFWSCWNGFQLVQVIPEPQKLKPSRLVHTSLAPLCTAGVSLGTSEVRLLY